MSIEAGCNGVEATIVLIAAVVAFPATWRERLLAIVIDTRILSYSIPFYAALHFALGGERLWSRFFCGIVRALPAVDSRPGLPGPGGGVGHTAQAPPAVSRYTRMDPGVSDRGRRLILQFHRIPLAPDGIPTSC